MPSFEVIQGAQVGNSIHVLKNLERLKKKSVKEAFVIYLYLVLGTLSWTKAIKGRNNF